MKKTKKLPVYTERELQIFREGFPFAGILAQFWMNEVFVRHGKLELTVTAKY